MWAAPEKPWEKLVGQIFLGSDDFTSGMQKVLSGKQQIKEIPKTQRYLDRPL